MFLKEALIIIYRDSLRAALKPVHEKKGTAALKLTLITVVLLYEISPGTKISVFSLCNVGNEPPNPQ